MHSEAFPSTLNLVNDLTEIMALFDLRLNSILQNNSPHPTIQERGTKLAQIYSYAIINKENQKIFKRLFGRVNQKISGIQQSAKIKRVQQLQKLKQQVSRASKAVSVSQVIISILGLTNVKQVSVTSNDCWEKPFQNKLFVESDNVRQGIQQMKLTIQNYRYGKDDKKLISFDYSNLYKNLDLNDYDFSKRVKRAQEEYQRNCKFMFEEARERNSNISAQIKDYQQCYHRYKQQKLTRKKKIKFKMFTQGSYDIEIKQYTQKKWQLGHKKPKNDIKQKIIRTNIGNLTKKTTQSSKKLKSNSAASLVHQSLEEKRKEQFRKLFNKQSSGSIFPLSKVNFIDGSDANVRIKGSSQNKINGLIMDRKNKIRFRQEFYLKKCRAQSIISKMKTAQVKNEALPPMQQSLVICKKFQI